MERKWRWDPIVCRTKPEYQKSLQLSRVEIVKTTTQKRVQEEQSESKVPEVKSERTGKWIKIATITWEQLYYGWLRKSWSIAA